MFEIMKKYLALRWQRWLNTLLLIAVASFIFPMIIATDNVMILLFWQQIALLLSNDLQATMALVAVIFPLLMGLLKDPKWDVEIRRPDRFGGSSSRKVSRHTPVSLYINVGR